jgi:hypothetical protein
MVYTDECVGSGWILVDEPFLVKGVTVELIETLDVGMAVILITVLFVVGNGVVSVAVSLPAIGVGVDVFVNVERCTVEVLSWYIEESFSPRNILDVVIMVVAEDKSIGVLFMVAREEIFQFTQEWRVCSVSGNLNSFRYRCGNYDRNVFAVSPESYLLFKNLE